MAQPRRAHPIHQVFDKGNVTAAQNGQAHDMCAILQRSGYDFFWGEADTLIGDVHATVSGAYRNLLGPVRMSVQSGFAHKELEATAQFLADHIDGIAQIIQAFGHVGLASAHTGGPTVFSVHGSHLCRPFACCDPGTRGLDRGWHDVFTGSRRCSQIRKCGLNSVAVTFRAPLVQAIDLVVLDRGIHNHDATIACHQWRRLTSLVLVHTDNNGFAPFDPAQTFGVRAHQLCLHIVDRRNRTAHRIEIAQLMARAVFQRLNLCVNGRIAVKEVIKFQQVGFIGHDLLHPHGPLLIPGPGKAKRFVPRGQLHRTGARLFRQGHGQHFDQDAVDIVFRLLLGQAKRVDLNAVPEPAVLGVCNTVTRLADLVPQIDKGPHLAHLGHKADACVHKERNASDECGEICRINARLQLVQNGRGGRKRKGQFLLGRGSCLLQVVGTDVHRVPFWHVRIAILGHIRDHFQRGFGRADIGATAQVFLDQVVLDCALQGRDIGTLFFGHSDIKRQQPWRCRIDGHRGVHLIQRDVLKQRAHIAQMGHWNANLANLTARQHMIAVISRLCG